MKNDCHYCRQRPLLLSEGILQDQRSQNSDKIQIMCRICKKLSHVSINNSTEINEKFVLACLHTGTSHSHLDSYLNIVGLPSISNQNFKGIERKVGKEIEQVEEQSCKKWKEAEIVINSFYTGLDYFSKYRLLIDSNLDIFLFLSYQTLYPDYLLIFLNFKYMRKGLLLPIIDYPFSCSLIRHLDGQIWLYFRQCFKLLSDGNSKLPPTLLPLYGNNKVMKM